MDERIFQFKAGQPIPDWDLQHRLSISNPVGPECRDTGTIFRINSTFMDVTDQPYMSRQWLGGGVSFAVLGLAAFIFSAADIVGHNKNSLEGIPFASVVIALIAISLFSYIAVKYGRDEFFALKRRPIRFNREEKKIYTIRRRRLFPKQGQGDITWEIPWDEKSIFCIHRGSADNKHTYHIRHYDVDHNGNVVRAFSIGRKWEEKENLQGLLSQWNYWCWYMNHGPVSLPKPPMFFSEHEDLRESFLFCMYDFGMQASAVYRITMMPFILLMTGYRRLAVCTSRHPIWPKAVADVSIIDPDDPYNEPRGATPIGWGQTVLAKQRGDYPTDPKKEVKEWRGEQDPALNALLWAEDIPPRH